MRPNDSRGSGRRSSRGPRRSSSRSRNNSAARPPQTPPAKQTFWQKLVSIFRRSPSPATTNGAKHTGTNGNGSPAPQRESRAARKPEAVEVTSPKLYVGNLSYEATENDLSELFKGVGAVRNAEIVTRKYDEKSKGFGFVTMTTVDEAKRAVIELHDKEFMGRKLVVSGAKTGEREPNYRG